MDMPEFSNEKINPRTAENWLAGKAPNRRYRDAKAEQYAQDMKDGRWVLNGIPIVFSTDGAVMDGQHRLSAIVKFGKPVWMSIARGVASEAMLTFDGGLPRKLRDFLVLRGASHAALLGPIIHSMWRWDHHKTFVRTNIHAEPTVQQALDYFDAHSDEFSYAAMLGSAKRLKCMVSGATLGALYIVLCGRSEEDADDFFERWSSGVDMGERHPVMALRRRLLDNKTSREKMRAEQIAALAIKAWNAYRQGRDIQTLAWRAGGKTPEPFPAPV